MSKLHEDIVGELENFGLDTPEDDVMIKLTGMCSELALKPSDLADEWMAFSVNNSNLDLDLAGVTKFERYKLSNTTPQIKKEGRSALNSTTQIGELFDDILDAYLPEGSPVRMSFPQKRPLESPTTFRVPKMTKTPTRTNKNLSRLPQDLACSLSPVNASPSQSYSQRKGSGGVVCTYNGGGITAITSWTGGGNIRITMSDTSLKQPFKYMFQKLSSKADSLDEHLDIMGEMYSRGNDNVQFENIAIPAQGETSVVGRICCDSTGKMNASSVLLEGSLDISNGKTVPLDLTMLERYTLFPGQIVGLSGTNPTGKKFVPTRVFDPVPLQMKIEHLPDSNITVFGACGPFTSPDSLAYEPLTQLLEEVSVQSPDVLILMGPFVDIKHPLIEKGDIGNMTLDDLFNNQIKHIMGSIPSTTRLIIVPSQRDVTCDSVYPQPPPDLPTSTTMVVCPDPVVLDVNGVLFGITSTDILFHLSSEEIAHQAGSDRMGRLTSHLLNQHNFYPLHPASDSVNMEYGKFIKHCFFESKPHVLLLPSDLRYFIKNVQSTVVVNPGKLGRGSGTYFRMKISGSGQVSESTFANVVKI